MSNDLTVGVDIGGTKLLIVFGDERFCVPTGSSFTSMQLEGEIRRFLHKFEDISSGIGIAVPGLIDSTGCIQACDVLPGIVGWNPAEALSNMNCPIRVINDVKAALLEEFYDSEPNLTGGVIMVGTGVGAAFQTEGFPLLGARGWAGELGYMPMCINGEVKRLDELAGGAFIAKKLRTNSQNLALLAKESDEEALKLIRKGGYSLGIALAAVINLLNPAKLVLGG
jgi:predicted NBD/HSP70 family sugar kinase